MKKSELESVINAENEIIKLSHERISMAKKKYLEHNAPFDINCKVSIKSANGSVVFGFVKNYILTYSNRIEPIIFGIKKDGSQSSRKIFIWGNEKIEKA